MIVLFHVQHLLGIGHLTRTATLARALAGEGFEVTVASGGEPVPGIDFGRARLAQLPAARVADRRFKQLIDEHGDPAGDAWKVRRRDRLLALYEELRPDFVVTELFPFGRRQLRFELLPLLERCAEDRARSAKAANRVFGAGHPRGVAENPSATGKCSRPCAGTTTGSSCTATRVFVTFDATFPHAAEIADRIAYTGYVVARSDGSTAHPVQDAAGGEGEVIVSAGGGAVGGRLLEAALAARPLTPLADFGWRLLAGANLPESEFRSLASRAPSGVVVERFRPDFRTLLRGARLSISQGGYNTLMEVLDAGVRAIVVPYAGGLESEQTLRADLFAAQGLVEVVREDRLDAGVDCRCRRPGAAQASAGRSRKGRHLGRHGHRPLAARARATRRARRSFRSAPAPANLKSFPGRAPGRLRRPFAGVQVRLRLVASHPFAKPRRARLQCTSVLGELRQVTPERPDFAPGRVPERSDGIPVEDVLAPVEREVVGGEGGMGMLRHRPPGSSRPFAAPSGAAATGS